MPEDTFTSKVGSVAVFSKDCYRDPIFTFDFSCRPNIGDKIIRENIVYVVEEIRHGEFGLILGVTRLGEILYGRLL